MSRRVAALRAGDYAATVERTRPDGRVVELRRNRLPDGGFVTLYTDITARRESVSALREANALAEAATKAMSRFVAIVSHEIRTPLNALLNSLSLLADSGMAATQQGLLDMARQSGDALLALINDVLEMSRMEVGQLALRPSLFALRPLIESTIEMFGAQAAERRIALRLSIAQGVPDELYEDPGRLRQVLINLLSNAVKFADAGEVRVMADAAPARRCAHAPPGGARPRPGDSRCEPRPPVRTVLPPGGRRRRGSSRHGARADDLPAPGGADGRRDRLLGVDRRRSRRRQRVLADAADQAGTRRGAAGGDARRCAVAARAAADADPSGRGHPRQPVRHRHAAAPRRPSGRCGQQWARGDQRRGEPALRPDPDGHLHAGHERS